MATQELLEFVTSPEYFSGVTTGALIAKTIQYVIKAQVKKRLGGGSTSESNNK